MTRARLLELLARLGSLRIAVAGDLFLDRWYEIDEALNEMRQELYETFDIANDAYGGDSS